MQDAPSFAQSAAVPRETGLRNRTDCGKQQSGDREQQRTRVGREQRGMKCGLSTPVQRKVHALCACHAQCFAAVWSAAFLALLQRFLQRRCRLQQ